MTNPNIKDYGWKKGQSGNPNGRPKKEWTMAGLIREELDKVEPNSNTNYKQLIAKRLVVMGLSGDMNAIKEVNDRIDGKAKQQTDITSGGEKISQVEFILDDES